MRIGEARAEFVFALILATIGLLVVAIPHMFGQP